LSSSSLLWSLVFGSIGMGFFVYGKKQGSPAPLICGLLLMVFPYFVSNDVVMVLMGLGLIAAPYFFRN
jgi:hypothetical protein